MSEVKDEIMLLKDRLDLCELKNKDLENKLAKVSGAKRQPSPIKDFCD